MGPFCRARGRGQRAVSRGLQPVDDMPAQGVAGLQRRVVEQRVRRHPQPDHDRLRRLVEHRRHRPDMVQADSIERHVRGGGGGLGGVPLVPRVPGQPPAHLHAARAGDAVGHRVQAGEPDELGRGGHLERPQAEALPVEEGLHAVDAGVAGRPVQGGREVAHHLRVGVHRRVRVPVRFAPPAHHQAAGADGVEPARHAARVALRPGWPGRWRPGSAWRPAAFGLPPVDLDGLLDGQSLGLRQELVDEPDRHHAQGDVNVRPTCGQGPAHDGPESLPEKSSGPCRSGAAAFDAWAREGGGAGRRPGP